MLIKSNRWIWLSCFHFQLICSYLFMPLAFIMGVEWADCRMVAELIGLKTFLNEFYAYDILGGYIRNRETGEGPTLSVNDNVFLANM